MPFIIITWLNYNLMLVPIYNNKWFKFLKYKLHAPICFVYIIIIIPKFQKNQINNDSSRNYVLKNIIFLLRLTKRKILYIDISICLDLYHKFAQTVWTKSNVWIIYFWYLKTRILNLLCGAVNYCTIISETQT